MSTSERLEKLGKGRLKKFMEFMEGYEPDKLPTIEIMDKILEKTETAIKYANLNFNYPQIKVNKSLGLAILLVVVILIAGLGYFIFQNQKLIKLL